MQILVLSRLSLIHIRVAHATHIIPFFLLLTNQVSKRNRLSLLLSGLIRNGNQSFVLLSLIRFFLPLLNQLTIRIDIILGLMLFTCA